ncbi:MULTISPECIES: GNAT family N-acetyltransferase [unclassified Mycobacterium]|uniref:GNAT family N-acetyltransferase n=1 Tax=unclassified Mycobacterium TaxID=2642494 RepID=UPI0029C81415|nr:MULTISPECIES: GNAT family N-acetyltransferase [unclassified Mycobacterium]
MTGRPLIRPATVADVADIEDVVKAAYAPYVSRIGRKPAPMTVDYRTVVAATDQAWVLIDGAELVGLIVVIVQSDHLLIENVAISPAAQGCGYGQLLLGYAEQLAQERCLPQTRLYTNAAMTENLAFYPRMGYVEVARRSQDGFERVFFVKDVGPKPR